MTCPDRCRDRQRLEVVPMEPQPLREAHDHARRQPALDDLARHRTLEERLDGLRHVGRREAVARHGLAVEVDEELRDARLLLVREVDDARAPAASSFSALADSPRRTERSGPKTLTARLVLLPEIMWSMRWLIGWPKLTLTPGSSPRPVRISASSTGLGRPGRSTTSISEAFTPWTCSSFSARPVRRLVETTSGKARSAFSTSRPRLSPSLSGVPEGTHERDGEAALVERRQERLPQEWQDREGRDEAPRTAPPRTSARLSRQKVSVRS